jgi:hypothetical protein
VLKLIAILWLLAMTGTVIKYRYKVNKRLKHRSYEKSKEGKGEESQPKKES